MIDNQQRIAQEIIDQYTSSFATPSSTNDQLALISKKNQNQSKKKSNEKEEMEHIFRKLLSSKNVKKSQFGLLFPVKVQNFLDPIKSFVINSDWEIYFNPKEQGLMGQSSQFNKFKRINTCK